MPRLDTQLLPRSRRPLARSAVTSSTLALALLFALLSPIPTYAGGDSSRLDKDLTPVGAERAGNSDGTIPAWDGGLHEPGSRRAGEHYRDPFAEDPVLFTIDHSNYADHAEHLTPGQIAFLKRYPGYAMRIYPTRRSAAFPDYFYAATRGNVGQAKMVIGDGGRSGLRDAEIGIPFPMPKDGLEAIWNHLVRFRTPHYSRTNIEVTPTASGDYQIKKLRENILFRYHQPDKGDDGMLFMYMSKTLAPPRRAGQIILCYDYLARDLTPRSCWAYNPGLRRVRRAPQISYDNPWDDGVRTVDQYDIFNGDTDRYDWRLVGKREIYIPYNSYRLQGDTLRYDDIFKPGHINPEHVRYELHRVWVIEATLRDRRRHLYPRRVIYLDEDSWQSALGEYYDRSDRLWRVSENFGLQFYDVPMYLTNGEAHYDLRTGRYNAQGFYNEDEAPDFSQRMHPGQFSPSALRRAGRR